MKISYDSTVSPDSSLAVKTTEELNAKTLLTAFLAQTHVVEDIFCDSAAYNEYCERLELLRETDKKLYLLFDKLPLILCECFLEFLAQSPHVKVYLS